MRLPVKTGNNDATSTKYSTTMVYYCVNFISNTSKLQDYNTIFGQVFKASELEFKAEYLSSTQSNINPYW